MTDSLRLALESGAQRPAGRKQLRAVLAAAGDHAPDLAFASIAFQSGLISQDWLARAADCWEREQQSFSDHLMEQGLISHDQKVQIESRAANWLSQTWIESAMETKMSEKIRSENFAAELLSSGEALDEGLLSGLGQTMGLDTSLAPLGNGPKQTDRQVQSRFTLIRKLGEGGLGRVWLARDEQLKRMVAIKETNEISSRSPAALERFRREAEITGRLEHPNIVPLYQFGTDHESDQPFYAMRFLGKRNLSEAIAEFHERNQGRLDQVGLHKLLTAFVGTCQAIAYAHSRGVIHRDLKPDNVALDNFGQVIVLDWGLAKVVEEADLLRDVVDLGLASDSLEQTVVGQVIGTPMYMAPEQAVGKHDEIDEKTDVYGLGAILFSILTGLAPHQNSTGSLSSGSHSMKELLKTIAQNPTPAPTSVNPRVPRDLERICMTAMAKKRHARFGTVTELAEEIERWMAGQDERRQTFENMRLSGRELKVNVSASIRDLATNVRFMSILPPIQEIIDIYANREAADESHDWWKQEPEMNSWRDRLQTIFSGLLQSNRDFQTVSFSRFGDGSFREVCRLERHSTDASRIRAVPISRLANGLISKFAINVMKQKPDEVHLEVVSQSEDLSAGCGELLISAGVPVFDQNSEEPFGFVSIEIQLEHLVDQSFRISGGQEFFQMLVLTDDHSIIYHRCQKKGQIHCSSGKQLGDLYPEIEAKSELIFGEDEYIDELDRHLYAVQIPLSGRNHKLTFVLLQLDVKHQWKG